MSLLSQNSVGIEGRITIRLGDTVSISSSRPVVAAKLLCGKTPQQASDIVPLLFNVCGVAQSAACQLALSEARAEPSETASTLTYQRALVLVEIARESTLRILRDTPALLQLSPTADVDYPYIARLVASFKNTLSNADQDNTAVLREIDALAQFLNKQVFGVDTNDFTEINDIEAMHEWANSANTPASQVTQLMMQADWCSQGHHDNAFHPLPKLDLNAVASQLRSEQAFDFVAAPQWDGVCHETGSFARQSGHALLKVVEKHHGIGILARWLARLLDLALIPQNLRQALSGDASVCRISTAKTGNACGIAAVEAARGRLIHMAQVEDGCISDYKILAPTEWNFHPHGVVASSLGAIDASDVDKRHRMAHMLIHTIDPCVAYQLEAA